ncbi:hypothetical protein DSLASN_23320 [Desulfoluna limicola]|uniref:Uncharacterized protein n=1 Tax=Desulfoluna limicola TaxID=2810562 RepID=A0ABM7PHD7_9BACT|nr:hypothetical protein DSLASN_23320 [Desulfoluna limicola]
MVLRAAARFHAVGCRIAVARAVRQVAWCAAALKLGVARGIACVYGMGGETCK